MAQLRFIGPVSTRFDPLPYAFDVCRLDSAFFFGRHGIVIVAWQLHSVYQLALFCIARDDRRQVALSAEIDRVLSIESIATFLLGGTVAIVAMAFEDRLRCFEQSNSWVYNDRLGCCS